MKLLNLFKKAIVFVIETTQEVKASIQKARDQKYKNT
jgi:hypothetical protein